MKRGSDQFKVYLAALKPIEYVKIIGAVYDYVTFQSNVSGQYVSQLIETVRDRRLAVALRSIVGVRLANTDSTLAEAYINEVYPKSLRHLLMAIIEDPLTVRYAAVAILKTFGANAHVYLPGIGTLSGLTAGNYLLSDGSTGYTPVDGLMGLGLDAAGAVGSELNNDAGFNTPGSWSVTNAGWVVSGGVATATAVPDAQSLFRPSIVTVGKTYVVTFDVISISSGGVYVIIGGTYGVSVNNTVGSKTAVVTASSNTNINLISSGLTNCVIDNFSVREITGIHATASGAARPRLERGARNLLVNSVIANGTSGAEGSTASPPTNWTFPANTGNVTFSGTIVRFVATAQRPFLAQDVGTLAVGSYTFSAKVESGSSATIQDVLSVATGTATIGALTYKKNNVAALGTDPCTAGDTVSVLFSVTVSGIPQKRFGLGCTGASTGDITMSSPQLELGSTASAYSPTTTAAASNPNEGKYSWAFEGAQSMALGSVPFQMSDDHCVCFAIKPTDVSSNKVVFSIVGTSGTAIAFDMNIAAGTLACYYRDDAATTVVCGNSTPVVAGATYIVTLQRTGTTVVSRVNGIQVDSKSLAGLGATTVTAAGVGAYYAGTLANFFIGSIGAGYAIKGTTTAADLLTLERFVASLTPNAPTF